MSGYTCESCGCTLTEGTARCPHCGAQITTEVAQLEASCAVCGKKLYGNHVTWVTHSTRKKRPLEYDEPPLAYQCQKCQTVFCADCRPSICPNCGCRLQDPWSGRQYTTFQPEEVWIQAGLPVTWPSRCTRCCGRGSMNSEVVAFSVPIKLLKEVLVSSTLRDLVAGSGVQYAEGRQCAIEGISGSWAVFPLK